MSGRKQIGFLAALVCSVSLIAASVTAVLGEAYYSRAQFQMLGGIFRDIIEEQPDSERAVLEVLKAHKDNPQTAEQENILAAYGYQPADFLAVRQKNWLYFGMAGFLAGALLFVSALWLRQKKEASRIEALTAYLEEVNSNGLGLHPRQEEDAFGRLQDEIYKTVTFACQTRDSALEARQNFADNLSNIAHQLKTPITAISLTAQMMEGTPAVQIRRQLDRLTHLEEALMLLSRLDAGTLVLEQREVDVFTLLTLAADNLLEVCSRADVSIDVPELGEAWMRADLDWTMEAVMNLMKNCMEHTPEGGAVHCSYEQNPLYTQVRIWDEGRGFAKEDLPRLFERFYRGQNAAEGGIGIGLSLAKAIIERQNGTISARNLPEGGACFEIRIYSH